ncbi:hypothetical protein [Streptomyces sp. NPDC018584]|uniref:hypothetical protein n=1 Tax=unclassified Streptomyces TaxID=2593676 RepID=UPI003795DD4B
MHYRLKYDPGVEAVHDALPAEVSEQLSIALAAACADPLNATRAYNDIEDDVMRLIDTDHTRAVILLGHTFKTLTVLQISYLG